MSILSTSSKLVRVGNSYSAGEGISIENNVISVTGDYGHAYSAGENISISDDHIISSKDWSSDIDTAVQNVSAETTAWVSEQGYITDASLSDYALITDVETTSGLLKMDIDSVSSLVSSFDSSINSLSSTVNSNSGTWNDVSNTVQTNSAQWAEDGGDEEVNSFVYNNSATINDVNTSYQSNSGTFLTAVDLTPYATTGDLNTASSFLSGAIDYISANAGDEFPASANDAITAYQTYSGTYLTNSSAEVTYQPIGQYASASDITGFATKNELETTSGNIVNLIPSTAGLATEQLVQDTSATITGMIPSTGGLATETDLQIVSGGVDYISGVALTSIPTGTMNITGFEYNGDDLITAYNGSAFAGQGGGSVDTIPVAVISPLVTGFSGESAYLGIESTALNLSSYVPVSAIGVDSWGYVSGISGRHISAEHACTAQYAHYAARAGIADQDSNYNIITSYYQPKLNIAGSDGTITAINSSAIGGTMTAAFELSAGAGISITDDLDVSATVISVTAAGGNPEVESYVQSHSASIDDAVSTYQTNSGSYLTQETDWTNTITAASSYAYSEAVAQIPAPFDPSYMSGAIDYISVVAITALPGDLATTGDINDLAQSISETYQAKGDYLVRSDSANFYPMIGNPSGFLTTHQDISNKLDTTAFSDVSGSFLTAVDLSNYYTKSETSGATELSNAFGSIVQGDTDVNSYVQTNSSTIDNTVTNVSTNSGAWGGSALPISAGPGISLSMVDGVLLISVTGGN